MTGRRDPASREAIEATAAILGDRYVHLGNGSWLRADHAPPVSMLCEGGAHHACDGTALDAVAEDLVPCPCTCHDEHGWGVPRDPTHA